MNFLSDLLGVLDGPYRAPWWLFFPWIAMAAGGFAYNLHQLEEPIKKRWFKTWLGLTLFRWLILLVPIVLTLLLSTLSTSSSGEVFGLVFMFFLFFFVPETWGLAFFWPYFYMEPGLGKALLLFPLIAAFNPLPAWLCAYSATLSEREPVKTSKARRRTLAFGILAASISALILLSNIFLGTLFCSPAPGVLYELCLPGSEKRELAGPVSQCGPLIDWWRGPSKLERLKKEGWKPCPRKETPPNIIPPAAPKENSDSARTTEELYLRGLRDFQRGRLKEACQHWKRVLEIQPLYPNALAGIGRIRQQKPSACP